MTTITATRAKPETETLWTIDPTHSSVEFAVKHLMIATVKGRFARFEGTVRVDESDPASALVHAKIDAASVDTSMPQRDDHLRSADFFDASAHPHLEFRSTGVEPRANGTFSVRGDLTIRGVTREVVLDVSDEGEAKDPWGKRRRALLAETRIRRADFGLTWNQALETGGVLVGDQVRITLNLALVAA